jgi:hypothetical protein
MKELMAGWIERSATEVDPVESIFQSSSLLLVTLCFITSSYPHQPRREENKAMRCALTPMTRPILVVPRTRIVARSYTLKSMRSTLDYMGSRLYTSGLRSNTLDHHIRHISIPTSSRYSTTTSPKSTNDDDHSALNPLPLPHSINPSKGLFLIHLPIPPNHWPSHLDLYFPLLRKTTKLMKERRVVVNCIYDGTGTDVEFKEGGRYFARLFTRKGSLKWDGFEEGKLGSEEFKEQVDGLVDGTTDSITLKKEEEVGEILVCTHGSRDCRCSNLGGQLVESLRMEIKSRGLGVVVREIAHVGGHK